MRLSALCLAGLVLIHALPVALAQSGGEAAGSEATAPAPPPDPGMARARELYKTGVDAVKALDWSRGLAAFEESNKLNPHATTTFNIGACERALGNYLRARDAFRRALEQDKQNPGQLAASLEEEARTLSVELEKLLAHALVTVDPPQAEIVVDGRPLVQKGKGAHGPILEAGTEQPGRGQRVPAAAFEMVLNPGAHVITLRRKGYADAVVPKSFAAGSTSKLTLYLARLPATIRISANVSDALVQVGAADVGPVPVDVSRPAGTYHVVVSKDGYDPYETDVHVQAGELSDLRAKLKLTTHPITKEWWFWAGAAGVVVAGAVATYALTRPTPDPPPYDGGSTGWVARPTHFSF